MTVVPRMPAGKIRAADIPVALFREILVWPLALHLRPVGDDEDAVLRATTRTVDTLTRLHREGQSCWEPVDDPSEHIPPPAPTERAAWCAQRYAEGVYFHDFVQSFLFSPRTQRPKFPPNCDGDLDQEPFRLFRRLDIVKVEVTLAGSGPPRTLKLAVERVNLYLFRTGAAILVVEVLLDHPATGQRWRLSDVQDFHEQFRRAYIPFANKHGNPVPDMVVCRVTWHRADDARSFEITADTLKGMIGQYLKPTERDPPTRLKRRSPPLFEHWQWLLENALPLANARREVDGAAWHHVVDERMPTIATISVTPPADSALNKLHYFNATHQGDLIRLCFADAAGSDLFPYDRDSLRDFDKDHTYRAFHHQGTLFMISGYAFVAYGADGFFDEVVAPIHMRRHYFQIGLLAHLELASLLSFSSRISRVVADHNPALHPAETFERAMHAVEDEYLQFIHRFHFTGASNHVQAHAIGTLWRRQLRLPEIFDDLHKEITSATQYLFNRAASRAAATTERLSLIGLFGVIASLSIALLSMTYVAEREDLRGILSGFEGWILRRPVVSAKGDVWVLEQFALICFAVAMFSLPAWWGMRWLRRHEKRKSVADAPAEAGPRLAGIARLWTRGRIRLRGIVTPARAGPRRAPSLFDRIERLLRWLVALSVVGVVLIGASLLWQAWR